MTRVLRWLGARPVRSIGVVAVVFVVCLAAVGTVTAGFRAGAHILDAGADGSHEFEISGCSTGIFPAAADRRYGTWRIVDAASGDVVADNTHAVYTAVLVTETFGPRECKTALTVSWDGHYWNQDQAPVDGTPVVGENVPAGRYRFEAFWGELRANPVQFEV